MSFNLKTLEEMVEKCDVVVFAGGISARLEGESSEVSFILNTKDFEQINSEGKSKLVPGKY